MHFFETMNPVLVTYSPGFVKVLASVGHSTGSPKTLAQRACSHINKSQFLLNLKKKKEKKEDVTSCSSVLQEDMSTKNELTYWCGVPLQVTVKLAQVNQIRLFHKTCLCPGSIKDRCSMTLETRGKK